MIKLQSILPIVLHQLYSHCIRKTSFMSLSNLYKILSSDADKLENNTFYLSTQCSYRFLSCPNWRCLDNLMKKPDDFLKKITSIRTFNRRKHKNKLKHITIPYKMLILNFPSWITLNDIKRNSWVRMLVNLSYFCTFVPEPKTTLKGLKAMSLSNTWQLYKV